MAELIVEPNPFIGYRHRLDSYAAVRSGKLSDGQFVDLVGSLDAEVAKLDGSGFAVTPVFDGTSLIADVAPGARLTVKVDANNVSGSHKARHLFGVALHLLVDEALGCPRPSRLAIASCGNAALAAGVVARALGIALDVFVPTWAEQVIVDRLGDLGARVQRCERRDDEVGDPAYLRFREAVAAGAGPFSVQGTDTPTTFDGGRTLGWEIADQVRGVDSVYVQVGGGALATAVGSALPDARLLPVQAQGCAPLARAWSKLEPDFDFAAAEADPDAYMWAWADPQSLASGILDDVTYDWLPLLQLTRASGGSPVVAPEAAIETAVATAAGSSQVAVSATGTAGLAGLLHQPPADGEHAVAIFTGAER